MTDLNNMAEVMYFLPHRFPFLLVDRIIEVEDSKCIRGIKNVTINEPFFQGHFPHHPIMPGVLIVEALAQLSGILAFKVTDRAPEDGFLYYLAGLDKTRFKRPVHPGDQLLLESTVAHERNQILKFNCVARVGEDIVCSTDLTVAGVEA